MGITVTRSEAEIIRALRNLTGNADPRLVDASQRIKLGEFADLLTGM